MATVQLSDLQINTPYMQYIQQESMVSDALVRAGAIVEDDFLNNFLLGDGQMVNMPNFHDLADDAENVSSDDPDSDSTPGNIGTAQDVAVALRRNYSWSTMDLSREINSADPLAAIAARTSAYWRGRRHALVIALLSGIFKANDKSGSAGGGDGSAGSGDLTYVSGAVSYSDGVTDVNHDTLIQTLGTLGEHQDLPGGALYVHPTVYTNMKLDNLITVEHPSDQALPIEFYGTLRVIQDSGLPNGDLLGNGNSDYESWILPGGALRLGNGLPKVPVEIERKPSAGDGGGQDILHQRLTQCLHLPGYAWNVSQANTAVGGPGNGATQYNLNHADSWLRVYQERAQIPVARLISTEA